MKLMVRAENPGGRARAITVLRNLNLISGGFPVDGCRVDEIDEFYDDQAYHANLWIVEPALSQVKDLWATIKQQAANTYTEKQNLPGRKVPGGWMINNVMFIRDDTIATPRRVWA